MPLLTEVRRENSVEPLVDGGVPFLHSESF